MNTLGSTTQTILQLELHGLCLIVLAIIWLSGDRRRMSRTDVDTRLFRVMLLSTAIMLGVNSFTVLLNGRPGPFARSVVLVSNTLYYMFHVFPLPLAILYADYQIFRDERRFSRLAPPLTIVMAFLLVLAVLSPVLGLLFRVDDRNLYARGPWFPVFAASQFLLSIYLVGHIVHNRKRMNRKVFLVLVAYPLPMIIASALQTVFYGLILLWPTMTLFIVTVAFNLENRRSKTDFLTGAANRRSLDEELERRIELCKSGRNLYGLLLDIDAFKGINDRFGHGAGDRALEDVSNILHSSVRVNDLVARMGGDEFVVLVDSKEALELTGLVHRIEVAVSNLNSSDQRPYQLSLSIGRSIYDPRTGGTGRDFLAVLDTDMYARKEKRPENPVDGEHP